MRGEEVEPLAGFLRLADEAGYHFITVTPETHRRVAERRGGEPARYLRDVFGLRIPFALGLLAAKLLGLA